MTANGTSVGRILSSTRLEEIVLAIEQHISAADAKALNGEARAVVSHFMHNPAVQVPFMSDRLRDEIRQYINTDFSVKASTSNKKDSYDGFPFPPPKKPKFSFIDLFAGIGGFRLALQDRGGACLFSSEWDKNSKKTYQRNFGETPFGDIRTIPEDQIPDHDILCAGFPCQPFSRAGVSARNSLNSAHGFACETQGTLFFDIVRILRAKRPRVAFLENVKNIIGHDGGHTFQVIKSSIESLGYSFSYRLIDASPLVPQRRVRCYMVCVRDSDQEFEFPNVDGKPLPLASILENPPMDDYTISDRLWAGHQRRTQRNLDRGTGFTAFVADISKPSNTIVARYGKDGKECLIPQEGKNPRMLSPRECARLQGFPESFLIPTAKTVAYKQFGNSVAIPVIGLIADSILEQYPELNAV